MTLHYQSKKPQLDLPTTPQKASVRLPAVPLQPDGRSLFDAPTLDLEGIFVTHPQNDRPPLSSSETKQKNLTAKKYAPGISTAIIGGTETLFESGDLMARLENMVSNGNSMHKELELPEIPPLPNWQQTDTKSHDNVHEEEYDDAYKTATPSRVEFSVPPEQVQPEQIRQTHDWPADSVVTPQEGAREEPEMIPVQIIPVQNTPRRAIWPNGRPKQSPVYRKKVRPEKSLELLLPTMPRGAFTLPKIVTQPDAHAFRPRGHELLTTEGLTKSYYKKKLKIPVLKGVTFHVDPGEFISIVGQSGSGKSTLLHLLGTLDKPESGTIHFEGRRIDNLSSSKRDRLRNHSIGFIFQFYHLLPELTMLENVLSPLMIRESSLSYFFKRKRYIERARQLLDQVGLSHRLKHKPNELSGGEMQRAAIARALIAEPKILLADEPTGNLDAASAREVIELLRRLKDQWNLTIVMVTHDSGIADTADRVVRMVDGVIVADH